jgi:2-polyprenyl-3-methyl-5-hydroxy-6-metoxy-1,4-benzoquinol methylase
MQLQTITDDYLKQNRELHEINANYGMGSWRHAQKVLDIREETECDTVLDYGCGKGALKKALGASDWCREYDPAIPGKDARPQMADLVVCTDVLEHIEPELLGNVLTDIVRLTSKAAFLVIATRESNKCLPDGSSPHRIVANAEWWRAKLAEHFFVIDFAPHGTSEVAAIVSPVRPIKQIVGKSAVSDTIRYENAFRNCGVVSNRVLRDLQPRQDERVCIVGYGPSLRQTWYTLLTERRAFGAKIVSVSGAHDFLISRGIVPDYHIEVDPREHKCFFTRTPHPDVAYWVASCCHPKLIDNLVEHKSKLALWHLYNSDADLKIIDKDGPDAGSLLICGGSGVGARAVHLLFAMGYRTFSLYGMDCSFAVENGEQHAGEHSGKQKPEWNVRVGDRWFRSSAQLVYMARSMVDSFRMLEQVCVTNGEPCIAGLSDHVEYFLHGDGLLQQMIIENNRASVEAVP